MAKLKHERPEEAEAFRLYYEMGSKRSRERVAEMVGVHPNTIKNWSKRHDWNERVKVLDEQTSTVILTETARATAVMKEQTKMIAQELKDEFFERVKNGDIKLKGVRDFIDIDKHDLLVRGEATERHESVRVELKGHVRDMLEIMGKKVAAMPNEDFIDVKFSITNPVEEHDVPEE